MASANLLNRIGVRPGRRQVEMMLGVVTREVEPTTASVSIAYV